MEEQERATAQESEPTQEEYEKALEAAMDRFNDIANDPELGGAVKLDKIELDAILSYTLAIMIAQKGMPVVEMVRFSTMMEHSQSLQQTVKAIATMAFGLGVRSERSARRG